MFFNPVVVWLKSGWLLTQINQQNEEIEMTKKESCTCAWCEETTSYVVGDGVVECEHCGEFFNEYDPEDDDDG